ncbi:MAG: acylphosphatase [Nitrospiria bacterium]
MQHQQEEKDIITAAQILVSGRVQGVGFRKFSQDCAVRLGLSGTVQNLADGRVAVHVEGSPEQIEPFISRLQEGPRLSRVDAVEVSWDSASKHLSTFSIIT